MNKIGEWTEKVKVIKDNLQGCEVVTEEGEVVRLHANAIEDLAMEIVNYAEKLNGTDERSLANEKTKEIMKMKEERTEFENTLLEVCGSFYFNFYQRVLEFKPEMMFRFLYLCSHMNYDGYLSNGKRLLVKEDLKELLLLKKAEYHNTINYLIENQLISFTEKNNILINDYYCKKGKINKSKKTEVVRMFNNMIKNIYEMSQPKEHKRLALLIKILPYLNFRFNVLCHNPDCDTIELVQPISLPDLAEALGYSRPNASKLKKDLFKLRIDGELVIGIFESDNGKVILVNPKLMYKATSGLEEFSYLINKFKEEKCSLFDVRG